MKPLLIIANFKSNKTTLEANDWLQEISNKVILSESKYQISNISDKEVIICPSLTLLSIFKEFIRDQKLPIKLGAQDISAYDQGAYTGEVNGKQIKELADYVLIGHSERRSLLKESDKLIEEKVKKAIAVNLQPIFFVQNVGTPIPRGVEIIVYEPPESISTVSGGVADNPKDVSETISQLRGSHSFKYALYGGSVDSQNVFTFTSLPNVDGVVPGRASLDALEFLKIIENA